MGGAAALIAAVRNIAAVRFVSFTPITARTVPTSAPTVRTEVAPEPVSAPGISITSVRRSRQTVRCSLNLATILRTMKATPPDSFTSIMKNVAVMNVRQTSKYVNIPSTIWRTGKISPEYVTPW